MEQGFHLRSEQYRWDDYVDDDYEVEVYVWNERLGTYVFLPEDEGAPGGHGGTEERTTHRGMDVNAAELPTPQSLADDILPPDDRVNCALPPTLPDSPSFLPPLDISAAQLPVYEGATLPIILEEADRAELEDCYDVFSRASVGTSFSLPSSCANGLGTDASQSRSSPCSMVSDFTYVAPQTYADTTIQTPIADDERPWPTGGETLDQLSEEGYSGTFMDGLRATVSRCF